jgi:peptidoglycan hydrolase-like protein with peptidoglycan-binding domain
VIWVKSHRLGLVSLGTLASLFVVTPVGAQGVTTTVVRASSQVALRVTKNMPVLRLTFSSPESASSLPTLVTTPEVPTRWISVGPREVEAVALQSPAAAVSYHINVPSTLACSTTCSVQTTRVVSTQLTLNNTWTAQLLAELNYLPVSFSSPDGPFAVAQVPGTFTWRFPDLTTLRSLWSLGTTNTVLTAALMRFQDANGLPDSGITDPATWAALVSAVENHRFNTASYNYVLVSQTQPENLTLYENGKVALRALVNTGIPQSPTQVGTYPVYLRYVTQTMRGTNPNGTKYVDPGIPWVSYFYGGDALHGFIRASYGFPQSLGCVEMPFATAGQVWPHTPIGTLVTVLP